MSISCEILVNEPKGRAFKSGDKITGVVKYTISKATEFKNIVISFRGKGGGTFQQSMFGKGRDFTSREYNIRQDWNISQTEGKETVTLKKGDYEYPFEFILPSKIPSSDREGDCFICRSYSVDITYTIPVNFQSEDSFFCLIKRFSREIEVEGDLNPVAPDEPIAYVVEKSATSATGNKNGLFKLKAEIEKSFVTAGEDIILNIEIENGSYINKDSLELKLVKKVELPQRSSSHETEIIWNFERVYDGGSYPILEGQKVTKTVKIPTEPEMISIQNSSIIKQDYYVKVEVKQSQSHLDSCLEIPVVIWKKSSEFCCRR